MGNPVAAVVDAFAGSNERPAATGDMGVPLARFVKLGRLDAVDMEVVVAVTPPPRPKAVPVAMVVGVPKVKPVSPRREKIKCHQNTGRDLFFELKRARGHFPIHVFEASSSYLSWISACRRTIRCSEASPSYTSKFTPIAYLAEVNG